jgi:retron-type reverse transcriptase
MTKGREKSDRRTVLRKGGNAPGGTAATASEEARQLGLFGETADSPQGADGGAEVDRSTSESRAVPKSRNRPVQCLPAMTMEEVASDGNLKRAFRHVASNKGAPGPDRQSVSWVRKHLEELVPRLQRELTEGTHRPGMVRRVWIPKPGGRRGLGIPNVVDRWVQQAVHQVLAPHYEPTFHDSSHGFRPGRSCHTAIAEARGHLEEGHEWVVDLDLEKIFRSGPTSTPTRPA